MRVYITLILFLAIISVSQAQSQFQIAIGGTSGESPYSMIKTNDGGYAIAGSTSSFNVGAGSIYLLKLNSAGSIQWSKTLSTGTGNLAEAYSIYQTSDAGYIVTGYVILNSNYRNVYLAKLDSSGNLQWNKSIQQNGFNFGMSAIQTADGGYAVAEFEDGNFQVVLKFSSNGTLQWNKIIEGAPWNLLGDLCSVIKQTSDGGYVVGSSTNTFGAGGYDFYIVKLDSTGSLIWAKTIGGTANEILYSMTQTSDGSFVLAGTTFSFGAGNWDMYIVKINSTGNLVWSKTIGGASTDKAFSVAQTSDGGFALEGWVSAGSASGMCIVKLDSAGTLVWIKGTNHFSNTIYGFHPMVLTRDAGFLMGGITVDYGSGNADIYLVKIDANGNNCGTVLTPSVSSSSVGTMITQTPQVAPSILTVVTPSLNAGSGGNVVNVCTTVGVNNNETELPHDFMLHQNYPNPFNPETTIKFDIPANVSVKVVLYDISGKEVTTLVNESLAPGSYEVKFNASTYSSGVYFYRLVSGDYIDVKKMILVK